MKQSFEQYLAAALIKGTLRHFSRLHADYLQEQHRMNRNIPDNMRDTGSVTDKNNLTVPAPEAVQNFTAHRVDSKDLLTGVDTRQQAADVTMPPQPAVRAENNDSAGS